jgi:hypothetical protein
MSDSVLAELWKLKYRLHHTPQRRPTPQDRPEPQAEVMRWLRDLGLRTCPSFPLGVCDADAVFWTTVEGQRIPAFLIEIVPGGGGEEGRRARLLRRYKQLDVLLRLRLPVLVIEYSDPRNVAVLRYRGPMDYQEEFVGSLKGLDAYLVDKLERAYKFYTNRLRQRP